MATITIGEQKLTVQRPKDFADRVLATTGLSIAEAAACLANAALPYLLVKAIIPLLGDDGPVPADVAAMLDGAELQPVADQLAPFYAADASAKPNGAQDGK